MIAEGVRGARFPGCWEMLWERSHGAKPNLRTNVNLRNATVTHPRIAAVTHPRTPAQRVIMHWLHDHALLCKA